MEENDDVTDFFGFIPANSCEYDDTISNCKDLMKVVNCDHDLLKTNCPATCKCSDKIY